MYKPIAIAEVDLSQPLQPMVLDPMYETCRVLLKSRGVPVDWVQVPLTEGCLSADDLQQRIIRQKGFDVLHRLMQQQVGDRPPVEYPAISVVVCTRNRVQSLSTCLIHLLNLDYPDFEIIIVDNAPADEHTHELVKDLPVRYVQEPVPGLDHARNRGIAEARHDLIAFTDDDVKVDRQWLKAVAKNFDNPDVIAVTGLVAPASLDTKAEHLFELAYGGMGKGFMKRYWHRDWTTPLRMLWSSGMGVGANMAFRKQLFSRIGGFDPALDMGTPTRGGGDIEMFYRVVSSGFILTYDPSVLVWHQHRTSLPALRQQIRDNGSGFASYLFSVLLQKRVGLFTWLRFFLISWIGKWIIGSLILKKRRLPARYVLQELAGLVMSPYLFYTSKRRSQKTKERKKTASPAITMAMNNRPPVNG